MDQPAPESRLSPVSRAIPLDECAVMDAIGDGVLVVDGERRILRANTAAGRILGCAPELLAERELAAVLPNADAHVALWDPDAVGARTADIHALAVDGRAFPATLGVGPIDAGGERWHVVTIRDTTDQVRVERQLVDRSLRDALTGLPTRALFLEQV
jgi:PAS domain S-box-containing protein